MNSMMYLKCKSLLCSIYRAHNVKDFEEKSRQLAELIEILQIEWKYTDNTIRRCRQFYKDH